MSFRYPSAARRSGKIAPLLARANGRLCAAIAGLLLLPFVAQAQLAPQWTSSVSLGTAFAAGLEGLQVDPDGVSYMTGIGGPSPNTDILTSSFNPDGSLRWSQTWDSVASGADQSRAITKSASGIVYVAGNTPGPNFYANILVLGYDAATGALLKTIQYSSGNFRSEFASSIVTDAVGNIYITGGTVGDGPDVITVKFDPTGKVLWKRTWDGGAVAPYSLDYPVKILLDPSGDVVVAISGTMPNNHPDYVVVKYNPATGAQIWAKTWGLDGGDFASDMEIDASGDIYVTGTAFNFTDKFGTIKLRGSDGQLLWQAYDSNGFNHHANGLSLDGIGGVFVTGSSDPDGDISNSNDDYFTVKRDATSGALLWTHAYGDPCVGCYDASTDVRVDPAGNVFVVGATTSAPFVADQLLLVLDTGTGQEINRGTIVGSGSTLVSGGTLRFDAAFNLYDGYNVSDANVGTLSMALSKWASLTSSSECETPTNLTATRIRSSSAQITWSAVTGALSYSVQYRQVNTNRWKISSTTATSANLKKLRPNTSYEYQVATVCADGSSPYSPLQTFTTAP